MDVSIFLARILSLLYLSIGLGILFNPSHYRQMIGEMQKSAAVVYIAAIITLVFGFLIVTYHNVWDLSWAVLITIIGWLALIKGVLLFIIPSAMLRLSQLLANKKNFFLIEGIIVIILGLVLGYFGFIE